METCTSTESQRVSSWYSGKCWKNIKTSDAVSSVKALFLKVSVQLSTLTSTWISVVTYRSKTKLQLYWSYSNYCSYKLNLSADAASHWKRSRLFVWKHNRKSNETVTTLAVLFVKCSSEAKNERNERIKEIYSSDCEGNHYIFEIQNEAHGHDIPDIQIQSHRN